MDIIFIREKQTTLNAIQQVNNSIIDKIQKAFNVADKDTESLTLPVVPIENPFKKVADINNYKGLSAAFNIPSDVSLDELTWSSIFPVYKSYPFIRAASNLNGFDYVDFLEERQKNKMPLRLIAYDKNNITSATTETLTSGITTQNAVKSAIKVLFDDLVLVKDFQYKIDSVRDIEYQLTLVKFNSEITDYSNPQMDRRINWTNLAQQSAGNVTTKYALQSVGLI